MKNPSLMAMLQQGYFPKELPPTFNTKMFGVIASTQITKMEAAAASCKWANLSRHHFARPGTLRRTFSIPNPIFQFQLARTLSDNWKDIDALINKSNLSISKPVAGGADDRAIRPQTRRGDLLDERLKHRASNRFMLKADISQFYPTIYTHTIPWALHTRPVAKEKWKDKTLLGNIIDSNLQYGQDRQTKGIPIGPDTSLVVAEILLAACDIELQNRCPNLRGFRYYDDYELYFDSRAEAESVLPELEATLASFELTLNPRKSSVETVLQPLDHPWARIRRVEVRSGDPARQRSDLIFLFEEAFQLARDFPAEHVLKYAIGRIENVRIQEENLGLFSRLMCQSVMIEHAVLPLVLNLLLWYRQEDAKAFDGALDDDLLVDVLNRHVVTQTRLGNSSEVAWAIWGATAFRKRLGADATKAASEYEDSFVGLLTLAARNKGVLTNTSVNEAWWQAQMTTEALLGEHWLFAYEAVAQGWLKRKVLSGTDRAKAAKGLFDYLKGRKVRFFSDSYSHDPAMKHVETYGDASADDDEEEDEEEEDDEGIEY